MRLIDADELNERFESSCTTECACCPYSDDNCGLVHEADTINAIVIPKNATNGDVIKALFPDATFYDDMFGYGYVYSDGVRCDESYMMTYSKEWWNTPYKELNNEK